MTTISNVTDLNNLIGNIDIYLMDAILKGYFEDKKKVLDIGSGEGRNLIYFLKLGKDIYGVDTNPSSVKFCRMLARTIDKSFKSSHFLEADAKQLPFEGESFDVIISSAVMHFAKDEDEFTTMFAEAIRVLKHEGIIFIRMASEMGIDMVNSKNAFTFYLNRKLIDRLMDQFYLEKIEPVKSVMVETDREMTTLLLRKK